MTSQTLEQAKIMNQVYRVQSRFYDATRWLFLVGRDRAIEELGSLPVNASVLELGCGTSRNILHAAARFPRMSFYGVDVSDVMLGVAKKKLANSPFRERIHLTQGSAEDAHFALTFGRTEPFDAVLISFMLTMLPDEQTIRRVIENARVNLKPGGKLIVVDFSGYAPYPSWFRRSMLAWQKTVHVVPSVAHIHQMQDWREQGRGDLIQRPLLRDATRLAVFTVN